MDTVEYNLRGLKQTGQDDLNTFLTSLFETKFPKRLHESWREYSKDFKTVPPIQYLLAFHKEKMDTLPEITPAKAEHKLEYKKLKTSVQAIQPTPPTNKCSTCKGERHTLYLCPYKSMDTDARYSHVRSLNLCFNCLGSGHRTKECRSNSLCKKCSKSHHTTLHKIMPSNTKNAVSTSLPDAHQQDDAIVNTVEPRSALEPTLQMTSQVLLHSASGKQVMVRALLDPGASISLITNRVVQHLQLKKTPQHIVITGAQGSDTGISSHAVDVCVLPVHSKKEKLSLYVSVVSKVTCDLPLQEASSVKQLSHLKDLAFADSTFDKPCQIDLLLGCNILQDIISQDVRWGTSSQPIAIKTIFGWALLGRYSPDCELSISSSLSRPIYHVLSSPNTDSILQQFWNIEEVATGHTALNLTQEEQVVVDHFKKTHLYLPTGRYQVTLLRKSDVSELGESRAKAVQRFLTNEHSIILKGTYEAFQKVVQEYLDLGHAEPVPQESLTVPSHSSYYLPMHGVTKESSSTTKLRVVFDASAKTSTGISFNDTFMIGPTLFPSLSEILISFRKYSVAITADISKMYRAVEIYEQDRDFHRFVWRPDRTSTIQDFRMTRVTFGVAASSYVAVQTLQQTAHDFGHHFREAKKSCTIIFLCI